MSHEARVRDLGLDVPDFSVTPYTGLKYGAVRPHRIVGTVLYLSGHLPELPDGQVSHAGALGDALTTEQGYAAARIAGLNALAGIRLALGTLDRVVSVIASLNFVVCTRDYHEIHLVADGVTDLLRDVFGQDAGIGGRATVGIGSLARNHCFETLVTLEIQPGA